MVKSFSSMVEGIELVQEFHDIMTKYVDTTMTEIPALCDIYEGILMSEYDHDVSNIMPKQAFGRIVNIAQRYKEIIEEQPQDIYI